MSIFSGFTHLLGSLFGGNDDEKKKQQAAAAKQSASQPALSVQPSQGGQTVTVAPPEDNGVNVAASLKKVNGDKPSPKQVAAQKWLDANGGAPDPNYQSKSPNILDVASEAAKGVGSSLVKVGDAALGGVDHLGKVISYPILTHQYENMVKKGEIDNATAAQLENEAGNAAGFKINDSSPTVLRKVAGAVAGPTATILTAGAAPEVMAGAKTLTPAMQLLRGAGSGAALGAGFGGINTLTQDEPITPGDVAKNVGLGAVTGAALGAVAPTVSRVAGDMIGKFRGAPAEIAPGVTSGANAATDLTEHNLAIAQASGQGSILDTPAYLRNRLALPAPRENVAVPINPGTPEGNVLLNQGKPQIAPTGVELQPAVPSKRVGVLDKTNSRMVASDVIPGSPEKLVVTPGKNVTDIGAPKGSADPASLKKARDTAIAKATGAENIAPHVPTPGAAPVETLVKKIENPAGSSDADLLKSMNDLITHPDAPQAAKEWAMAERDKLTGVADRMVPPPAAGAPAPEAPAPVAAKAPSPQPLKDVLPAAPGGAPVRVAQDVAPAKAAEAPPVAPSTGETPAAPDEARQALIDGLKSARTQSMEDAASLSSGRSARAGKMTGAADGLEGQAATDARRAAMAGSFDHRGKYTGIDGGDKVFETLRLQAQKDPELVNRPYSLDNVEEALSRATTGRSLDGKIENSAPTDAQINLLRKHFGNDVADAVKEKVDATTRMRDKLTAAAGEVAAVPKSIMASFDMSATLRQGGVLSSRFPKQAAAAAVEQVKYFASKEHFETAMKNIEDDPYFEAAQKSGLALTGVSSLEQAEEQFVGKIINKMPGIAGSDRAYSGFLTKLRFDTFKSIVDTYAAKGIELGGKELDDVSKFINTASGRGELGSLEKHANTLNTALFSPKLWKSRLDMLNPVYYAKLSGPARKYALQSAGTFASAAATVLGLASLAGAHVETDPTNSDFLKIKVGNTRYDILGGFQQNLVWAAREWTGQSTSSSSGETTQFATSVPDLLTGNPDAPEKSTGPFAGNRLTKLGDLVSNKLNPLLGAGKHILEGKGIGGQPVNVLGELANLVTPLGISNTVATANDAADLSLSDPVGSAKELGKAALKNVPDFIGVSTQTYGDVPTKYQPKTGDATDTTTLKKVPDAVQKTLDKKAEKARVEDFKKRDIPENQAGVDQRFQNNEFDKAIEGAKHLEDVANKKEELSVTDKAKYDLQINRATTMKDKGIKYNDFADYNKTTLSEWRNMGDPESDTYDPAAYQKLFEIDKALAEGKGSDNSKDPTLPKFSAKSAKGGSGRGGGSSSVKSNTIGNLPSLAKVSLGTLAPQKITTAAKMPTIQQVQPGELIKKRSISVGKA